MSRLPDFILVNIIFFIEIIVYPWRSTGRSSGKKNRPQEAAEAGRARPHAMMRRPAIPQRGAVRRLQNHCQGGIGAAAGTVGKNQGCGLGNGWCFFPWNSKGITRKTPQLWIQPRGKLEKKAVFSPCCGDETTTRYDRAIENGWCFFLEVPKG